MQAQGLHVELSGGRRPGCADDPAGQDEKCNADASAKALKGEAMSGRAS